jgi:uncharacterized delta-60 repeat protein
MKQTILFLIFLILLSVTASAVTEEWVRFYDGGIGNDYAKDIDLDSSGNIFVTGSIYGDGWEYATVGYDSSGTQLWAKHWNGPIANSGDTAEAIVVDSSGNVYVTGGSWQGTSQQDIVTIKYDNTGTQLWTPPPVWDGTGYYESAWDIDVDSSGNVYVAGMTHVNGAHRDCVLIKYNSAGTIQWVRTYDGGLSGFDAGYAVAVDATGSFIYVAGTCTQSAPNGQDTMVLKYSSGGTLQAGWPLTSNGSANGNDSLRDIAVTSGGDIYVTGLVNANTATNTDCITIKYTTAGGTVWTKTYDAGTSGNDEAEALVVDSAGNCMVTGASDDATGLQDYITIRYSSAIGNQDWATRYDSPSSGGDHAYGIDLDENKEVYVTGHSNGQYATVRYDWAGGAEVWAMRYNRPTGGGGNGEAIAVNDSSSIYVTGDSGGDFATIKYNNLTGTEPNKVKWEQLPDLAPTGIDVNATEPYILADDFNCTTPGPITKIVVWGSWLYDEYPDGDPQNARFTLSIHGDVPDPDPENPEDWSHPSDVLWYKSFDPFVSFTAEEYATDIQEGWMDPPQNYVFPADTVCWKYTFTIDPCDAFYQLGTPNEPVIYWLDVQAQPLEPFAKFGWKTSLDHWNDDAVWAIGQEPYFGMWNELRYPFGHEMETQSIDLAFAIYTDADEPNEPNEPEPKEFLRHLKWSQPPIEINPGANDITFCGWDEKSFSADYQDPNGRYKIVADDFRCLGTMPVTSIHWWGSYFDWEQGPGMPSVLPTSWWIGFWSNMPSAPQGPLPYSYPETLLKDFIVDANRVEIEEIGKDEYYGHSPYDICYQYNIELEPNEVFWQDEFKEQTQDDIFWLSIVAIYPDACEPYNPWGWKTRPWHWMDDAVTFNSMAIPAAGHVTDPLFIKPLKDPEWNESVDVTFELDTDPNYIKWEQDFNGIRNWPHYEDVTSTLNAAEPQNEILVADDWRCLTTKPVTAIVWWGSYIGYRYEACSQPPFMPLPIPPGRFLLKIWTDVPAGADPCYTYSHPNEVVWEYDAQQYDEVLVGYDKHPEFEEPFRTEPVFRYSVRLPEDAPFIQRDYNEVFWLSVQAVYDINQPNYLWGWTNHQHVFNDDAVQGHDDPALGWIWEEVHDQTGASADMSFVLFTDPDICYTGPDYSEWVNVGKPSCWCYPKQCHGDATGSDEEFGRGNYVSVGFNDFQLLLQGYNKNPYVDPVTNPWICADFTHSDEEFGRGNWVRVGFADFQILLSYYNDPCSTVPADCLTSSPVSP